MTTVAEEEQWHQQAAKQAVERFVRRFDESYRVLAYHAALPLVLTPELVNYLRNQFLRNENVPWVAEVDLLLSDLCSQVGYELYAMDTHIRGYLLEQMKQDPRFGKLRMQQVAQVLINYVKYLSRLHPGRKQKELEAQRWAAMVYLGDEQCKQAAREIAQRLIETTSETDSEHLTESGMRAELARLTHITAELSPQLQQEPALVEYARLMQRVLRQPDTVTPAELSHPYQLDDLELRVPDRVLPETLKNRVSPSGQTVTEVEGLPPLQTFQCKVLTIALRTGIETSPEIQLEAFDFKVATIELKQTGWFRRKTELIIKRHQHHAYGFTQDLGNGVELEMVAIPKGSFIMGFPETEEGHDDDESPQHPVTLKSFLMGKYPVTQEQWQAVAALPQVNRELEPNPSYFKGEDLPVETVSWYDALEFCERLSQYTKRPYRLPSEAEWEYACRAGTTTPFHFGETITTDLANYNGDYTYGSGSKGKYIGKTTPVGSFGVANNFGLYDMHGNVWEWCADHWHSNYEDAPTDGSAWKDDNDNDNKNNNKRRLLRGGSWYGIPVVCRSGSRDSYDPGLRLNDVTVGFRVVCGCAWTL
ncbi:MAG: formylglycine-generating enzyme family protein [Moorea sp. SIO3C2]|nr:formylglycine-generating enzyme family protein [Moorena sp. SIO3C2]